jgi:hypothetical protein
MAANTRNHHRHQNGGRIVNDALAGSLTHPSVLTARTMNR